MSWLLPLAGPLAEAHSGAVPVRGAYDWSNLPPAPPGAWNVWELYPSIVLGCAGLFALYAALAGPLRERFALSPEGPTRREWALFTASLLVVFFSLQGPLHELADIYLFSGHMVQHLLITLLFPPLFISGIPPWMWRPIVSRPWAAAFGRGLTSPIPAFLIAIGTLYLWHVPGMYVWALVDHNVHIVEHLMFMASAVVMWWPAYSRLAEVPPLTPGLRMVYLFVTTLPMKALGAIITVSDVIIYDYYAVQPRVWGIDPMMDQRLGGIIMWIPGGLVFWITIAWVFFKHFHADVTALRRGRPALDPRAEAAAAEPRAAGA